MRVLPIGDTIFTSGYTHVTVTSTSSSCAVLFYFNGGGGKASAVEEESTSPRITTLPPSLSVSPSPANNGERERGEVRGVSSFFSFFLLPLFIYLFIYFKVISA